MIQPEMDKLWTKIRSMPAISRLSLDQLQAVRDAVLSASSRADIPDESRDLVALAERQRDEHIHLHVADQSGQRQAG
jgi:hypothetical protein